MSRVIEKLLLFLGLCSRLREALVLDLVFFASAKLKSELSALLSASGSLGLRPSLLCLGKAQK